MNQENKAIINNLPKLKYYEFIRYALGLRAFLDKPDRVIQMRESEDGKEKAFYDRKEKERTIAYEKAEGRITNRFLIKEGDYDKRCFSDRYGEKYEAVSYFDSIDDDILRYLLYGIIGIDPKNNKEINVKLLDGKSLFGKYRPATVNFIIGAGINAGFGIGDWKSLIGDMRSEIRRIMGIPRPSTSIPDLLVKFETDMLNTNYIAPQILKDLDNVAYEQILHNSLYSGFNPSLTYKVHNPSIDDTNIFQVARIAANQPGECQILTFNYDDVLESIILNNFLVSYRSFYKSSKSPKSTPKISIIHSHGLCPYNSPSGHEVHSIVLSSYEYMASYEKSTSYARKRLDNHLANRNIIIGNSMSDYEEQKVFFSHHKRYPSVFSFLFMKSSGAGNEWMDCYKTIYYLRMGVIPVFFKDFIEMNNYLKTL